MWTLVRCVLIVKGVKRIAEAGQGHPGARARPCLGGWAHLLDEALVVNLAVDGLGHERVDCGGKEGQEPSAGQRRSGASDGGQVQGEACLPVG